MENFNFTDLALGRRGLENFNFTNLAQKSVGRRGLENLISLIWSYTILYCNLSKIGPPSKISPNPLKFVAKGVFLSMRLY